jgi:hypothetical protein
VLFHKAHFFHEAYVEHDRWLLHPACHPAMPARELPYCAEL